MADLRTGGLEGGLVREVRSVGVGARRVNFRLLRESRGRDGKGGLRRPGLGVIINF